MSLSPESLKRLTQADNRLQDVARAVAKIGFPFRVLAVYRDERLQNELFHQGLSKLKWPDSKHNCFPSRAIDITPEPVDWNNLPPFYILAGLFLATASSLGVKVRWGGDWNGNWNMKDQSFHDLGHFELLEE